MKKVIVRILGLMTGIAASVFGVQLLVSPIFNTTIEFINAITGIFFGILFIYYGLTSRSLIEDVLKIRYNEK